MNDYFDWTDERLERLRRLWAEGMSASKIGVQMGISKNSVVGKVHRLKLPSRPSPIQPRSEPKAKRAPKQTLPPVKPEQIVKEEPKPAVVARQVEPVKKPVAAPRVIADRPCQWPFGDPGETGFRFCGCPSERGRPYCAEHVAVAYVGAFTNREGFVPEIAVKRMADRGTLTAVGELWHGGE